jgi:hypothetical protein
MAVEASVTFFLLPLWSEEERAFVWPDELVSFRKVDASGTRPGGTSTLHCGSGSIAANTVLPCFGRMVSYDVECASMYARMYPAWLSPKSGVAIDGGLLNRPHRVKHANATDASDILIGCNGLSVFPYVREPRQTAALTTNAMVVSAPRSWCKDEKYAPLQDWLKANWSNVKAALALSDDAELSYASFPLSFIHIIDTVPCFREIVAVYLDDCLGGHGGQSPRLAEYHPPMPLLLLPHDVLVAFLNAVPGYTMQYLHALLTTPALTDQVPAFKAAFTTPIQKDRTYDIDKYAEFIRTVTASLHAFSADPTHPPLRLPALTSNAVVLSTPSSILKRQSPRTPLQTQPGSAFVSLPLIETPLSFGGETPFPLSFTPMPAPAPSAKRQRSNDVPLFLTGSNDGFVDVATPVFGAVAATPCFTAV